MPLNQTQQWCSGSPLPLPAISVEVHSFRPCQEPRKDTHMTPNEPLPNFTLKTDPMLANIGEVTESHFELVFIFGFIGKVTDDTVQLFQGLDLRKYYEIPRRAIVHVEAITCP